MYLKQELRSQVNGLVKQMNNNIQAAIKTVDGNFTTESIVYADWDAAFEGHRFCEPANKNWKSDAWFLTINGDDTTAAGVTTAANTNGTNSTEIDLKAYATTCQKSVNQTESDDMTTINEQILCDYAVGMANGSIPYDPDFNGNITTLEAVCQALHPKSVAHNTTAKVIRDLILGANSRSTTPAPPPIDTNSPACEACEKVLGASNCAASDLTCLRNQRSGDSNCKTCGYNCSTVGA
jgi:Tfp pilus assembly major pilin PilA